ncbi:hypothetical protein DV738_g4308, partial [Chaetothyriales sp. CBS 135597]
MATTARPSSAIGRIEGAFNRCIMRIAQAVQDPSTYGDSTKPFIQECALQFHDALDDCEVQILDAKWYLEHQLAQNKARRETRAREEEALATQKRKLDQLQDTDPREDDAKRARLDAPRDKKMAPKATELLAPQHTLGPASEADEKLTIVPQPLKADPDNIVHAPIDEFEPAELSSNRAVEPTKQTSKPTSTPQKQSSPQQPQVATTTADRPAVPTTDATSTPQVTPALTNDEFSFVSMFQEPSQDAGNSDGPHNHDLSLDADLGDDLARAVNGSGDMSFDLPPLNGPNEFDALFNEDGFDHMGTVGGGLDMDPDGAFSNEALNMENLDLDSMFN